MESIVGIVIGLAVAFAIAWYQERSPDLEVAATLDQTGRPDVLRCVVRNQGRRAATDVHIGFNRALPLQTVVVANSSFGASIVEAVERVDAQDMPRLAAVTKAFSVRLPLIPARKDVEFELQTVHPDNQRAAQQALHIRAVQQSALRAFGDRLNERYPRESVRWNLAAVIRAEEKEQNFFLPGSAWYEHGTVPIAFVTDEERLAQAANQDLYAKHKEEFIDIYQNRGQFTAPVLRVSTVDGERTLAIFPAYVMSGVRGSFRVPEEPGEVSIPIPVPARYDAEA